MLQNPLIDSIYNYQITKGLNLFLSLYLASVLTLFFNEIIDFRQVL